MLLIRVQRCLWLTVKTATSPTWNNIIEGQINLRDAVNRTISFQNPDGKEYKLKDETAVLLVRPRGLHLEEKYILLDGNPISAGLLILDCTFFHNTRELIGSRNRPILLFTKD